VSRRDEAAPSEALVTASLRDLCASCSVEGSLRDIAAGHGCSAERIESKGRGRFVRSRLAPDSAKATECICGARSARASISRRPDPSLDKGGLPRVVSPPLATTAPGRARGSLVCRSPGAIRGADPNASFNDNADRAASIEATVFDPARLVTAGIERTDPVLFAGVSPTIFAASALLAA
jgi:hypothetical protein